MVVVPKTDSAADVVTLPDRAAQAKAAAHGLRYVPAFDGSRGAAAIFVIAAHYGYFQCGWVSVQYFFILSGYLITSILLKERDRPLGGYLKKFYWRRSLRIFPIYFGYLALCTIAFLAIGEPRAFAESWAWLYTYTYNLAYVFGAVPSDRFFSHLWSLSAEEQFYVLWPFVIFFARGRSLKWILFALLVLIPISRFAAHFYAVSAGIRTHHVGRALYMGTMFQFDAFAAGALIAYLGLDRWKSAHKWFVALAAATLAGGIVSMIFFPPTITPGATPPGEANVVLRAGWSLGFPLMMVPRAQYVWGYTLVNLLSALLIIAMCHPNFLTRFLENRFLCYVGKMSYGIYVLHMAVLTFYRGWLPVDPRSWEGLAVFVAACASVIALAHLSYFYFEKFFLDIKEAKFAR